MSTRKCIRDFAGVLLLLTILSCNEEQPASDTTLFSRISPEACGIDFINRIDDRSEFTPYNTLYIYNGGGIAAGDLDNDGLIDLVFTANQTPAKVYRNTGDLIFEDVTVASGLDSRPPWVTGVTMADVNTDGFLDIYICRSGSDETEDMANLLYINNGDLTFTESAKSYGLDDAGGSIQAYFFDYDNDMDLDVFVVNHPTDFSKATDFYYFTRNLEDSVKRDKLFENRNNKFVDVSTEAGLDVDVGFGLSASIADVNDDGFADIFIANDFFGPDKIYFNNGDKTFSERSQDVFQTYSLFSMGSEFGDINNDGALDLLVADMAPFTHQRMNTHRFALPLDFYTLQNTIFDVDQRSRNMLFLNQNGLFNDIGELSGISRTEWSWSVFMEDLDLDGLSDVLISNGLKKDMNDLDFSKKKFNDVEYFKRVEFDNAQALIDSIPKSVQRNFIFRNRNGLEFEDVSADWGMELSNSQGAVVADLDNDGDLDLAFNNTDIEASVFRNNSTPTDREIIKLRLTDSLNVHGIGAEATLYKNGEVLQSKLMLPSRGYQSCSPYELVLSYPTSDPADSLVVVWPGQRSQRVPLHSGVLTVSSRTAQPMKTTAASASIFTAQPSSTIPVKHEEDEFNDFYRDKLSPFVVGRSGPVLEQVAMNQDNRTELIMGGSKQGQLLLIQPEQDNESSLSMLMDGLKSDVTSMVTADFNQDGHTDIFVLKGGNEYELDSPEYQPELLLGSPSGTFTPCSNCLPEMRVNGSVVSAADYDQDGDMDVFIGSRAVPKQYGQPADAFLLKNESGKFIIDGNNLLPQAGMITDASWTDMNGDNYPDLVYVGDWMRPKLYLNDKGILKEDDAFSAIPPGLWRTLELTDYDQDGDTDILVGNLGLNHLIKASNDEPVTLLGGDFDGNGSYETLMFHYLNGEQRIYQNMDEYCKTMPKFFNNFFTNKDFARADYEALVVEENTELAVTVEELRSGILINEDGIFEYQPFETELQLAPINDIHVADLNGDDLSDILLVGNDHSNHYLLGRVTANPGQVLLNQGDGVYKRADYDRTGLSLSGDVRSISNYELDGRHYYIFGTNDDSLQIYQQSIF